MLGFTVSTVFIPVLYATLPYISFLLPIVTLLAVTLAFLKLSTENELLAMISLQYGLNRIFKPLLFISSCLFLTLLASTMFIEPWGRYKLKEFIFNQSQNSLDSMIQNQIQEDTFMVNLLDYVFYTEKINKRENSFLNTVLIPQRRTLQNDFILTSPKTRFSGSMKSANLKMIFENGSIYSRNHI